MTDTLAAVLTAPQTRLVLEQLVIDPPVAGEVLVHYGASGVCHSDLHVVDGEWSSSLPIVLGHEGAGVIEEVGEGVSHVAVGDHVVASWWYPCGACRQCARGETWVCTGNRSTANTLHDGSTRLRRGDEGVFQYLSLGTFASRAVVPASAVVRVPATIPFDVACLIGCGVTTGVGAVVNTAAVEPGAAVAIVGCGGVGLSVIMGAVMAGADPIVAIDLSDAKLDQARDVGATHCIRADRPVRRELVAIVPGGVDYAFEAIGLKQTQELLPRLTRAGGTCVLVGMTPEDTPIAVDGLLFVSQGLSLLGSTYGSAVAAIEFPRLANLYLEGRLPIDRLITHRIELGEVNDAFDAMRRRERGRSVIVYRD